MLSVLDIYQLYGLQPAAARLPLPSGLVKNPKRFVKKIATIELERMIKEARDKYYNTGESIMSDQIYDVLEDELRKRSPKHKLLKQVGAPVTKSKVKLPYNLPSLDKLKNQAQLDKWSQRVRGDRFVISDKIDGVSLLIVSVKGKYQLFTRGNGTVGQDISYLAPLLKLPKTKKSFVVRGELVMPEETFKAKYRKQAENPRNLMSGLVNRKAVSSELKDAVFLAYEMIKPSKLKPSEQFAKLKAYGFKTAAYRSSKKLDENKLVKLLTKQKSASRYEVDGLVITADIAYRRVSSGNPDYMVAFKSLSANEGATATVVEVQWNVSKNGYLKPRVQIKPVRLAGTTVRWATGFNFKYIKQNKIGPGAKIKIIRSGDVIPRIMEVVKPARKAQLPDVRYTLNETGVDALVKSDKKSSGAMKIRQMVFFFQTMKIEGWKSGTIQRLIDAGYDDLLDIIHLDADDLIEIPGFQQRGATKLINNMDGVLWTSEGVDLAQLMTATGFFGRGVGLTRLEQLVSAFPQILTMKPAQIQRELTGVSGFSTTTIDKVVAGLDPFKKWLKKSKLKVRKTPKAAIKPKSSKLSSEVIVFTGFRDVELDQLIKSNGGTVGSGVSGKTTLVVYRGARISGKLAKAQERGIKVMNEEQFRRWIKRKTK